MEKKNKLIVFVSIIVLLLSSLTIWYFLPNIKGAIGIIVYFSLFALIISWLIKKILRKEFILPKRLEGNTKLINVAKIATFLIGFLLFFYGTATIAELPLEYTQKDLVLSIIIILPFAVVGFILLKLTLINFRHRRIAIVALSLIFVIFASLVAYDYYYNYQVIKENNDRVNALKQEEIRKNDLIQEQAKKAQEEQDKIRKALNNQFGSTEIVSNNLPKSIEFWTEASCPHLNLENGYKAPDGYYVSAEYCPDDQMGMHGGCPNCKMSKIVLKSGANQNMEKLKPLISKYCSKDQNVNDGAGFYINADRAGDKEILILCKKANNNDYFAVFDSKNQEVPILESEIECYLDSNGCQFKENLTIKDFDNNGLDEIAYSIAGGFVDRSSITWFHNRLYSFVDKKWYGCDGICEESLVDPTNPGRKELKKECNMDQCPGPWVYSESKKTWINN